MKVTHKINLPPKQGGYSICECTHEKLCPLHNTVQIPPTYHQKHGDISIYIEGELPHPQTLCIEYDDGVED